MTKSSNAISFLPPEAGAALASIGESLAIARVRRNESQRTWARRIGISVPTLIKMERGDPSVSMGVYATALWMIGLSGALGELAKPEKDLRALDADVRKISNTLSARKKASARASAAKKEVTEK